jgi:hypothetical protein
MAETDESAVPRRAVIVGAIPDQPTRVLKEAARYAKLFSPLIVAHVDVTRFVTYEDPDGYMHTAPIDIDLAIGRRSWVRSPAPRHPSSTARASTGASPSSSATRLWRSSTSPRRRRRA